MQTKAVWEPGLVAVIQAVRRVDWTAEAEEKDRRWQEEQCKRMKVSRRWVEHLVLTAEEEQRIRGLVDRFQAFRHPSHTREGQEQTSSADRAPPPVPTLPVDGPSPALLCLLREMSDVIRAEDALCIAADLPTYCNKYWSWLKDRQLQEVMDEVQPAWMTPGDIHADRQGGWDVVEELLVSLYSNFPV
jgi:hypothetical protein